MTRINSLDLFPLTRMRRMRRDAFSRRLRCEHTLSVDDLIYPMFIIEGKAQREPIGSMPSIERLTLDELINEAGELRDLDPDRVGDAAAGGVCGQRLGD